MSGPGPRRYLRLVYVQSPTEPPAVTWVAGSAPQSSAGPGEDAIVLSAEDPPWPVQVGLSERAAVALDVEPGDRLTVEDQYGQDVDVRISGIYSPDDPDDPAWTVARELLSPAVGTPTASSAPRWRRWSRRSRCPTCGSPYRPTS